MREFLPQSPATRKTLTETAQARLADVVAQYTKGEDMATKLQAPKFADVTCVCGMIAEQAVSYDQQYRCFRVHVSCKHGGKIRSPSPATMRVAAFPEATVALHDEKTGWIHPTGGELLGAGTEVVLNVGYQRERALPRGMLRTVVAAELAPGDVVREPSCLSVLLSKHQVGDEFACTFRRLGDDKYKRVSFKRDAQLVVVACRSTTGGDPDLWAWQQAEHEAEAAAAAQKVKDQHVSLSDEAASWVPQAGEPVAIQGRRNATWGGAQRAIANRVDVASMGGVMDVQIEATLLDGKYAGQRVKLRLGDYQPIGKLLTRTP